MKRRLTWTYGVQTAGSTRLLNIPTAGESAERVHKAVVFDKDDAIFRYYQWKEHEDSKRYTGVYTPSVQLHAARD